MRASRVERVPELVLSLLNALLVLIFAYVRFTHSPILASPAVWASFFAAVCLLVVFALWWRKTRDAFFLTSALTAVGLADSSRTVPSITVDTRVDDRCAGVNLGDCSDCIDTAAANRW